MEFLIIATLLTFGEINSIKLQTNCVLIRDKYYENELLNADVYVPYQLSIHYSSNTLFFTYTGKSKDSNYLNMLSYEVAFLKLNTKEFGHIYDVNGGFATAVDNLNGDVYIGGRNGIYLLDVKLNTTRNLDVIDLSMYQMFYRDGLYFTTYPDQEVFLYTNKDVVEIPDLYINGKVRMFAVKKDGVFVFSNKTGLYTYNKTTRAASYLGPYKITGFTSDVNNNIYFSTTSKIYYFGDRIEELAYLGDLFGLAIAENGDFIYATRDSIFRLTPSEKKCQLMNNDTSIHKP